MSGRNRRVGLWVVLSVVAGTVGFARPGFVAGDSETKPAEAVGRTIDEQFAAIARKMPSFGGMYLDEERNVLYVYSWDQSAGAGAAAEQAVTAVFGDKRPGARIQVLPARYGFHELKQWHDRLTPGVLGMPGVVMTDIDDRSNRLTVGVESLETKGAVEDRLFELGVPGEAVNIVETAPVAMEVATTLRARNRPIVGGQQIAFNRNGSTLICTLGFNAIRAGVAGYVTNSHCTAVQGGVNATAHHQPTIAPFPFPFLNRIGVETVDPLYFVGAPCPAGRRCRRSDSSFARRDAGVTASQGRIARPTALNTINWNTLNTFRIVREADPLVGQLVTKVGRTTGRTQGFVQQTCANFNVSGTTITQLCQSRASYLSNPGDSGSPVFRIVNIPAVNDVALGGIHWGSGGVFSTISNIQRNIFHVELGPLTTCAPGFVC